MKYLLLLLVLSGCATTMSEYQQGCQEGIRYASPAISFVPPEVDGLESREEQVLHFSENVCRNLEYKREQRRAVRHGHDK